jgi:hypothetical protein
MSGSLSGEAFIRWSRGSDPYSVEERPVAVAIVDGEEGQIHTLDLFPVEEQLVLAGG